MRYYRQSSSRDNRDRKCFSHHLAATTPESHGCRRVRWSTSAVKRHQVDSHWQVIIYSGKFSVPFARCRAVDDEYISSFTAENLACHSPGAGLLMMNIFRRSLTKTRSSSLCSKENSGPSSSRRPKSQGGYWPSGRDKVAIRKADFSSYKWRPFPMPSK